MEQSLAVVGPNLRDQSKGTFVVHAAGCSDLHKLRFEEQDATTSYKSLREVVENIYPPDQFEWRRGPDDSSYWNDIHFFPCVTLPKEA